EQSKAEGKAEGKKEDVFGMLSEGLSIDAIVRITKLPIATIQAWQKEWEQQAYSR
ncbi:MAG: flagellar assembly protein H, partial [Bacteroidetes bacterium]